MVRNLLLVPIILLVTSCDSQFEFKIGEKENEQVNQICTTNINGGGEKYWDISNVIKDCRKGEVLTTEVILWKEKTLSDISDYEHRLNYLTSKICDFDKQILITEMGHSIGKSEEVMKAYDLTCVYSGGFEMSKSKWIEEMENKE